MKFKTEARTRMIERTIDGVTHAVPEQYTVEVPVPPRDWDAVAVKAASGLVMALTVVAIVWSTYSIGQLLGGGVGYAAAALFDLSWLTVLVVEWLSRFDQRKRGFPKKVGWVLVVVAAAAIFTHGALQGDWALAAIGAAVSVIAKVLWLVVAKHIDREISDSDAAWMQAEVSAINTKEAIATVRLRAAAAEEKAALRLLEAERIRHQVEELSSRQAAPEVAAIAPSREESAELAEAASAQPLAQPMAPAPMSVAVRTDSDLAEPVEPPPAAAKQFGFGFSAHTEAQQAQRAVYIAQAADLLQEHPGLSASQLAVELGVSLASAKRYAAAARSGGR